MKDWAAVQRVYKQTKSKRATARILNISRNTVKRLLEMKEPPVYRRTDYSSKLDAYKELIIQWRCDPYDYNGTRIFRELKEKGYTGSIGPIYRFLSKVNEDIGNSISKKATVRHESPPGDQAQFDWTEYNILVGGRYQKVYCFAMILAASRKKAVCFSLKVDAEAIYEAIQELFENLGGIPKALVLENNPKSEDEVRYNPQALMLAKHLGTELNACPCYWPRKKGKIESPFKYIENQYVKGKRFANMEDLNRRVKQNVAKWCDEKHTTTQRIPNQHFWLEEKGLLQPLPKSRYRMKQMQRRKISPDSFVSINSNKYSVPVKYVGKTVQFRIVYGFRIELYDTMTNYLMSFEQADKKHQTFSDPEHYEAIAPKVSTSIPQIRRDFTKRYPNGLRYLDAAGRKFDQPTHYARKIMELQELYSLEVMDALIGISVDEDRMDIKGFKSLLKEY
ncbi:MAG: IS21 family transposase, partial [Clostridium sp.]